MKLPIDVALVAATILLALGGGAVVAADASTQSPLAPPVDQMRAALDAAAARGDFSGAVLIARRGEPLLEASYGFANRETGEENGLDTQFGLASLDKFITRLAIYQLLQAGKLRLDDPVGKLLPDLPNEDIKAKVTVQHLLDMRSGVPSFWNDRFFASLDRLRTTNDYLDLFVREPLRFEPGTRREYSNGGFILLGAIIERLSGMDYDAYVQKHIRQPAGMTSTGLLPNRPPAAGRAIGYTRAAPGGPGAGGRRDSGSASTGPGAFTPATAARANTLMLPFNGSAAGGGYSTARDLIRLDQAIRADRLLKPEFTDRFLKGSFRKGEGRPTGWNGGTPGHNVQFIMYPDGTTLVVLANQDPPAANRVAQQLAQMMGKTINLL
jgi:D-alanyl-D-alanine carboxypeptidase